MSQADLKGKSGTFFQDSGFQSVVPRPAAWAPRGNLLGMQISRPTASESLGPTVCVLASTPGDSDVS